MANSAQPSRKQAVTVTTPAAKQNVAIREAALSPGRRDRTVISSIHLHQLQQMG
jgi:hypothetical protein